MKPEDASYYVFRSSGLTAAKIAQNVGKQPHAFNPIIYRQQIPKLSTYALFCDACGFDLIVRDRYSGDETTIEP